MSVTNEEAVRQAQRDLARALEVLADLPGEPIRTFTGRLVHPLHVTPDDVIIEDIGWALSLQCRFAGHLIQTYSIAEHSVRVSRLVESWGDRSSALWGLLHDAGETWLTDLPAPIKHHPMMLGYRWAEQRAMRAVCERFGLPMEEPAIVKQADRVLLVTEQRDLRPKRTALAEKTSVEPLPETIVPWTAMMANREFLHRFAVLTNGKV